MKKVRSEAGQTTMTTAGPKSTAHKGLRGQEFWLSVFLVIYYCPVIHLNAADKRLF